MIGDGIGLEHRQFGIVKRREPWGVLVRKHGDDAGQRPRGARVDGHDSAPGNGALNREDVGHALDRVLVGVFRCAGDLLSPVDALQWRANRAHDELHLHDRFPSSVKSSSVRTRVLRASGTLNALPGSGCASASSASAA